MQISEGISIQPGEPLYRPEISALADHEIHPWCISLNPDVAFLEKCEASLTDLERKQKAWFNFKHVQDNYVITRGGLRLLLSAYLNIEPQKIQLSKHAKGKPFTTNDTSLYFNISNSGSHVVYAFSRAGEVGIDIERIRPLQDLEELIAKNFSEREKAFIVKKEAEKERKFFKFWTVKEAYLKAIGEGMRLSPDNLEFTFENNNFVLDAIRGVFERDEWLFSDFSIGDDYAGTLVYKGLQTSVSDIRFVN